MENKILLIDGHNLLFQMFFGMPARITNRDGIGIWGVIGFVGALRKIVAQIKPTHLAVLFDAEHTNERCEVNADYKANRPDFSTVADDENPFAQLPYIKEALKYLGIPYAETSICEVDDWMAGYAISLGAENELVISSFDSDFFQLISPRVKIFRYRGDNSVICDEGYLQSKFGIAPSQYADFKSLVGDTADNIRGAAGIGPKTAAMLLATYGTLADVIENAQSISKRAVRESILSSTEMLRDNYKIIKLENQYPLPFSLDEMKFTCAGFSTSEVIAGIGL